MPKIEEIFHMRYAGRVVVWAGMVLGVATAAFGADWPQWQGINRDGKSAETGLLAQWPDAGPTLAWKMEGMGQGYASVAIVGGRIYTTGDRRNDQLILCYDLSTRKELWTAKIGVAWQDGGARCTPTVDGDLVYAIGTYGDIVCVEAATGKEKWRRSFGKDFGGMMMSVWGFSESPLVDGEKVMCTPGGGDAAIVALNKRTGQTIWKTALPDFGNGGKNGAGYSSMVVAEVGGVRQYVQVLGRGVVGVAANDGKFLWGYNKIANPVANIPTPIVRGEYVFVSTGYKEGGSALLKLSGDASGIKAGEVWYHDAKTFQNHHGGVVLVGDYLYGGHGMNAGLPTCIEFLTGKIMWRAPRQIGRGSAAVAYADGHVYLRNEDGTMVLIEATPEAFRVKGKFKLDVVDGPSWAHPVIHDGKMYLRANDVLMCYDIHKP